MRWLYLVLWCLMVPAATLAQDRSGRDRPSDWVVKHYAAFGLWDSICDERVESGDLVQRCYLRYVDVYSSRPRFGAVFAFVFANDGETDIEFGFERGVRYREGGFRIERDGKTVWTLSNDCLRSGPCLFQQDDAASMLETFARGGRLVQHFTDRYGEIRRLQWDLWRFAEALEDYRGAAAQRALLN